MRSWMRDKSLPSGKVTNNFLFSTHYHEKDRSRALVKDLGSPYYMYAYVYLTAKKMLEGVLVK